MKQGRKPSVKASVSSKNATNSLEKGFQNESPPL